MSESVIANHLKGCKSIYVSYNIFFYKCTEPCFYITSINEDTYIGLRIDDFYFSNNDSGYYVKLREELNDKRKVTIYGLYDDGSLIILDCYKTAVSKSLFSDLDKSSVNDPNYYTYRLTEVTGTKYSLHDKPIEIKENNKWVVNDGNDQYFRDVEPALRYFRERINRYLKNDEVFVRDELICEDYDFSSILPLPLYKFYLDKKNSGLLTDEDRVILEAIEAIFFTFSLDERVDDEDFLMFKLIGDITEEEKRYSYNDSDYQIKINIEKEFFEINFVNDKTSIVLKSNALTTIKNKSYYFNSHITLLNSDMTLKEYNLDITYRRL